MWKSLRSADTKSKLVKGEYYKTRILKGVDAGGNDSYETLFMRYNGSCLDVLDLTLSLEDVDDVWMED